jgi:hypothetical protein
MGHPAVSTFGFSTPATYPLPQTALGLSSYAGQGPGIQPLSLQPYQQSLATPVTGGYAIGALQPWQQLQQLVQIVPQQLQQVQYLHQLQLFHLQQLLQLLPAQLQQIQQLLQVVVPQQVQQPWQAFGSPIPVQPGFNVGPQAFSGSASHVM